LAQGLLTAGYKQEQLHTKECGFEILQLDCIRCGGGSTLQCGVDKLPSQSKLHSPGHNKQQLLLLCISITAKGDNKLKHTHHYNSIISVMKEQAANPFQMSIIFTTLTQCH